MVALSKTAVDLQHPEVLPPSSKQDKQDANATHQRILNLIKETKAHEEDLEYSYVMLGQLICKMQMKQLWMCLGYNKWKDYFDFLQKQFGMGRTQLYGYVGTVKTLAPYVDDMALSDMGISKAHELKKAVATTGKAPSEALVEKGKDPKTSLSQFRQAVLEEFHIIDHNEKGTWRDFKGCYLTDEENEFLNKVFKLAKSIDPVVPHDQPAHVQFKEVLMRLAEEFWSQYGNQFVDSSESEPLPEPIESEG